MDLGILSNRVALNFFCADVIGVNISYFLPPPLLPLTLYLFPSPICLAHADVCFADEILELFGYLFSNSAIPRPLKPSATVIFLVSSTAHLEAMEFYLYVNPLLNFKHLLNCRFVWCSCLNELLNLNFWNSLSAKMSKDKQDLKKKEVIQAVIIDDLLCSELSAKGSKTPKVFIVCVWKKSKTFLILV